MRERRRACPTLRTVPRAEPPIVPAASPGRGAEAVPPDATRAADDERAATTATAARAHAGRGVWRGEGAMARGEGWPTLAWTFGRRARRRGLACSLGRPTPFVSREMPAQVRNGAKGQSGRVQGNLPQRVTIWRPRSRPTHSSTAQRPYHRPKPRPRHTRAHSRTGGLCLKPSSEEEAREPSSESHRM